ncbi:hypothetical protein IMG5_076440 [Ichthyophthirius multifiliis]|uniref:Uncharacterized protein n=1 Tax=Ichthyophthirius multifiliis TaxID=5932 RepID=G0QQB3_ICHMU|nr:hypothetical protein IMG5_076440 [Ichthyophthirius multifiliis]EGR32614.1 hypothetical protein IMG5_076440 [Ichthyophthirius multifiliis]|eukprot:XP_004036600.1 hypothetical protein IMG5_076440 [Ichthyophthirius multifiliis]
MAIATISGLVFKKQNMCISQGQKYAHPFMQSMTMYIGEALSLLFYFIYIKVFRQKYEKGKEEAIRKGLKTKINFFLLLIPTACDFITSTLAFFALEFMPLSIYSMVRGGGIIITALFQVQFLKKKLYRHHLLGLSFIIIGLVIVGLTVLIFQNNSSQDNNKLILGLILLICSFFTFSTQITLEEKLFGDYHLNAFQTVGIEGLWGIFICGLTVIGVSFIKCPSSIASDCPNGYLEDVPFFIKQVFIMEGKDQPWLLVTVILGVFTILFFNVASLAVTKYVNSLSRNVGIVTYPFIIWITSIAIGWEKFLAGQLVGYIVVSFGTLIYNEIIILKFWGLNIFTKSEIAKKEGNEKLVGDIPSAFSENILLE